MAFIVEMVGGVGGDSWHFCCNAWAWKQILQLTRENGLLLTPSIDHLFDRGFISFENSGEVVISPGAHRPSLQRMGVPTGQTINVDSFTDGQRKYLDFHRNVVLLRADR